jgi:hypothetical protein
VAFGAFQFWNSSGRKHAEDLGASIGGASAASEPALAIAAVNSNVQIRSIVS